MTYRNRQTPGQVTQFNNAAGEVFQEDSGLYTSFTGATATLQAILTAARAYTLPDQDGTLALLEREQTFSQQQNFVVEGNIPIRAERLVTTTNAIASAGVFRLTSSGDMVDGHGPQVTLSIQDDTLDPQNIATIAATRDGADNTGRMLFSVYVAGTFSRRLAVTSTGVIAGLGLLAATPAVSSAPLHAYTRDATANAISTVQAIDHDSGSAGAAGMGARQSWLLKSSTTSQQLAGAIDVVWTTATHATRTAKIDLSVTLAATETKRMTIADAVQIGDITGGNVSQFDNDGTLKFLGNATVFDDLRVEPNARTTGANSPTFEVYLTNGAGSRGVWLYSFDNAVAGSEKELFFTIQFPHGWKGTDVYPHVHFIPAANGTAMAVRWGLEYTWVEPGGTFGNTSIVYTATNVQGDVNLVANKHYIAAFSGITPSATQNDISSIAICRLFRDSANAADTYTNKAGLLYVDWHYEIDQIGSKSEYTK